MLGPHFYYDVVRLARRGRSTILRVLYILALLGGLTYAYETNPNLLTLERNDLARVAERFAFTLFVIQNLAVVVLTPAYLASALTEEKERRTLELLFTTQLSDTQIVLGKLTSRILHLVGFVIAGLPILSAIQFWGGIDMLLIAGNLVNTLLNIVTIGSFCLLVSALCQTTTGAVLTAYANVLPISFGLGMTMGGCPFVLQDARQSFETGVKVQDLVALAGAHLTMTGMCLALTIVSLRARETLERMRRPTDLVHQMGAPKPQPTTDVVSAPYTLPPITDNALLWKELYVGGPIHLPALALLVLALPFVLLGIVIILAWVVAHLNPGRDPADFERHFGEFSGVVRFFYYVFLATGVLEVGYRAAVTVASERQNQTLVPLLLLPIERGDILVAKLVGVLLHGWPWLALIGADLLLGVMIGAYHPFSAVLLCLTPWPVIVFFATLGLLLSVAMRTVLRAALTTLLLELAIFVFTCVLPMVWGSRPFIDRFAYSFRDGEPENFESIALPLVQLLPFAVAAFVCWKLAVRTFENRSGTD